MSFQLIGPDIWQMIFLYVLSLMKAFAFLYKKKSFVTLSYV